MLSTLCVQTETQVGARDWLILSKQPARFDAMSAELQVDYLCIYSRHTKASVSPHIFAEIVSRARHGRPLQTAMSAYFLCLNGMKD